MGYQQAGYRELLAVEWGDNAVKTFKANFPGIPVYHGDISKLGLEECLELSGVNPENWMCWMDLHPVRGFQPQVNAGYQIQEIHFSWSFVDC